MTPDVCEAFRRNLDGSWTCVKQSVLTVGAGQTITIEVDQTVKPGELLDDFDLAAYLEQACAGDDNAGDGPSSPYKALQSSAEPCLEQGFWLGLQDPAGRDARTFDDNSAALGVGFAPACGRVAEPRRRARSQRG